MQKISIKINFTGGIVSTGTLLNILGIAQEAQVSHVRFGLRQQLLADVPEKKYKEFVRVLTEKNISFEQKKEDFPNIVSSYAGAGIFLNDTWLSEGVYKDIFDQFEYRPQLKINICDHNQTLTPLFTGNINWIASPHHHFWYLYIRFPKTNIIFCWPELVYTNDVAVLSAKIEESILNHRSIFYGQKYVVGEKLFNMVKISLQYISKNIEKEMVLPSFKLPYYEGFNNYGNTSWLGIYRRDELFDVSFLIDLCRVCLQTKISQLYTTPWKSIIIKGIESQHRHLWDFILGKYRINVRHASNELNWQVEDHTPEGLILKRHIIRQFDKEDVRTYGLCFAIKTKTDSGVFGSVVIRKQENTNRNKLKSLDRFDILYTDGFNPNSKDYLVFRKDVEKDHLSIYLIALCKYYYDMQSASDLVRSIYIEEIPEENVEHISELVYQCPSCLSIYDESAGDIEYDIASGTAFDQLPQDYSCSICENPKESFLKIEKSGLGQMV